MDLPTNWAAEAARDRDDVLRRIAALEKRVERLESILLVANSSASIPNNRHLQELAIQRNRLAARSDLLR